jgi:hypothetical protein
MSPEKHKKTTHWPGVEHDKTWGVYFCHFYKHVIPACLSSNPLASAYDIFHNGNG